jgi:hypothetical protein
MSPEVEAAFPTEAQALFAGFQELFQRDVTAEDVRRYPTVGRGAYTTNEADWCNATYDFLEKQLDDVQRAKRNLPAKKRVRRSAAAAASAADAGGDGDGGGGGGGGGGGTAAAAAAAPRSSSMKAAGDATEDDDDQPIFTQKSKKRGRKPR